MKHRIQVQQGSRISRVGWALLLGILFWPAQSQAQDDASQMVNVGTPRIDLASVDRAVWQTSAAHGRDFNGWLQRFEDEVNAIYFATLRQQYPQNPPETLLPQPVRVEPQWVNGLLHLYGYLDQNNTPGYQANQDILLFTLQQTQPYNPNVGGLSYALFDGAGYYYRDTSYFHNWGAAVPLFAGFFVYPQYWRGAYWRPAFTWWNTPYWSSGLFYNRYTYYHRIYPTYYNTYRTTYYVRYRPWGWRSGVFFRTAGGRYYYRNPAWVVRHRPRHAYRSWIRTRHTVRRTQFRRHPVRTYRRHQIRKEHRRRKHRR